MNDLEYEQARDELESDPEYRAWCDERIAQAKEEIMTLTDEEIETSFPLKPLHKVFVYGSLKRGFGNHSYLTDSKFVGEAATDNFHYCMYSLGPFPAVRETDETAYNIGGELYEVDDHTLNRLDILEGNGIFYTRKLVRIRQGNDISKAWMYVIPQRESMESSDRSTGMYLVRTDVESDFWGIQSWHHRYR